MSEAHCGYTSLHEYVITITVSFVHKAPSLKLVLREIAADDYLALNSHSVGKSPRRISFYGQFVSAVFEKITSRDSPSYAITVFSHSRVCHWINAC